MSEAKRTYKLLMEDGTSVPAGDDLIGASARYGSSKDAVALLRVESVENIVLIKYRDSE